MAPVKVIIIGAAGRDFHNFNIVYRDNPAYRVVAFTATQIPEIDDRRYPPELAGPAYPDGISIHPMDELERLIRELKADLCVFSYSDVHYVDVMHVASRAVAAGAAFQFLPPAAAYIACTKPVVSVLAVRTGCGKSQTARRIMQVLRHDLGVSRVVAIRHPMPYGDLTLQRVERFAALSDLEKYGCTVEEREEFEPHIAAGNVVYAGVDYVEIVRQAQAEADVIVWEGGNNDAGFLKSDLTLVVADPLRPGHELLYWAGEVNLLTADIVIINKCNSARAEDIATVEANAHARNPRAAILTADSAVTVEEPALVKGKRVLVVEDGPTLTHGEMTYGAGVVAAREFGAAEIVSPAPYAVGSIKEAYLRYPQIGGLLPALGYYPEQLAELEQTIARAQCDTVLIATPVDLRRVIRIDKPATRVRYELREHDPEALRQSLQRAIAGGARGLADQGGGRQ